MVSSWHFITMRIMRYITLDSLVTKMKNTSKVSFRQFFKLSKRKWDKVCSMSYSIPLSHLHFSSITPLLWANIHISCTYLYLLVVMTSSTGWSPIHSWIADRHITTDNGRDIFNCWPQCALLLTRTCYKWISLKRRQMIWVEPLASQLVQMSWSVSYKLMVSGSTKIAGKKKHIEESYWGGNEQEAYHEPVFHIFKYKTSKCCKNDK